MAEEAEANLANSASAEDDESKVKKFTIPPEHFKDFSEVTMDNEEEFDYLTG